MSLVAGRPAAEGAEDRVAGEAGETHVAGAWIGLVSRTSQPPNVDVSKRVVDDARVSRLNFNCGDRAGFGQIRGQGEASVNVAAAGRNLKSLGHLQHKIGRPQGPAVGQTGEGGGKGVVFGPSGAPASAQARRVAISEGSSVRSCSKGGPTPDTGFQGGMKAPFGHIGQVASPTRGPCVRS